MAVPHRDRHARHDRRPPRRRARCRGRVRPRTQHELGSRHHPRRARPRHGRLVHDHHIKQGDHGRTGLMILVGDTFHNFVDGILIAAAFMADIQLGIVTAIAIIAHEIPQEIGDFLILLHSGFSRARALAFNLLSSVATLVGGLLAYFALQSLQNLVPPLLGIA
ncbi:MAG: ZIP family metal transporter, partial [Phycisphaerales bacterium]|nr:ZIP family metal transporter [Phycisphaerales bacterium]